MPPRMKARIGSIALSANPHTVWRRRCSINEYNAYLSHRRCTEQRDSSHRL